jgi:hypothetical protein
LDTRSPKGKGENADVDVVVQKTTRHMASFFWIFPLSLRMGLQEVRNSIRTHDARRFYRHVFHTIEVH